MMAKIFGLVRRRLATLVARLTNLHNAELRRLRSENRKLWAQLIDIEKEMIDTHVRLYSLEQGVRSDVSLSSPARRPKKSKTRDSLDNVIEANLYRERQSLILIPHLLELLPPGERIVIVDAGAREVDHDPRWRAFDPSRLKFVGFEPDAQEAARLNTTRMIDGIEIQIVAAGLWGSTGTINFQNNNIGGGSSFLSQNRQVTDRWKFENPDESALARDIFFPVRHESINVVSLADWSREADVGTVDFLKLNVQGGELEILQGAGPVLDNVLGILVEMAFVESYSKRPMFADIDRFLSKSGFTFFDLLAHHYVGRAAAPIVAQRLIIVEPKLGQLVSSWGQLIEGHGLYLRDPISDKRSRPLKPDQVIKLAALAEGFGQIEFAFELLQWLAGMSEADDPQLSKKLRAILKQSAEKYGEFQV